MQCSAINIDNDWPHLADNIIALLAVIVKRISLPNIRHQMAFSGAFTLYVCFTNLGFFSKKVHMQRKHRASLLKIAYVIISLNPDIAKV